MSEGLMIAVAIVFIANVGNIVGPDPLASEYGRLVFSTLIYRHGDRSIEKTYPNDPYADEYYWPMGFGQLTPIGIERQFELGKWLRKRYDEWLPETYDTKNVYVRSSDMDRTIMSAEANLAGLYEPVGPRDWNGAPGKRVQLVPIHTVPKAQDNIVAMSTTDCPMYLQEMDKLNSNLEIQHFYAQFSSVSDYIKNYTNLEMGSVLEMAYGYETLYYSLLIESQFNYSLPEWTKNIFPEPLQKIATVNFMLSTYNNIMKRLKSGPLLSEIITRMSEKINGTLSPDRMLWIYSAHDMTIINLLNAMGLYEFTLVPYSAVLMIELRTNATGNHVVTISYRNTSDHEPYLLHLPGCASTACELDQLINVLKPVLPVDWNVECQIKDENNFLEISVHVVGISIVAVVCILILYVIIVKIISCSWRPINYEAF